MKKTTDHFSKLTERAITETVAAHNERNRELHKQLTAQAVDLNQVRFIECHFWAPDEASANGLAADLQPEGFTVLASARAVQPVGRHLWNLELVVDASIKKALGEDFTERLVRAAARRSSIYDGWGTTI